jgi:acetate kinase
MSGTTVLTLNSGSSSLKFALFGKESPGEAAEPRELYSGAVEGIGSDQASLWIRGQSGEPVHQEPRAVPDQGVAFEAVAALFAGSRFPAPHAVGHRVVHGGPKLLQHTRITPDVIRELEAAAVFAPLHVPVEIRLIRLAEARFPGVPQFACFDTAFHRTLPEEASRFALPENFWQAGVRRYGFHGLSCESILHALGSPGPPRMILAHLGSGASITAILNGCSADTTMGLTPTGGIVMATRTGDLDPGVFLHLLRTTRLSPDRLEQLLDRQSGLLALSGFTGDMKRLHQASADPRARLAVEVFSRSARKGIGGLIAILGGLDLLVFTGGIGEHDALVRASICRGLEPFGIALDPAANEQNRETISASASVRVRVLKTNENAQIARHAYRLLLT